MRAFIQLMAFSFLAISAVLIGCKKKNDAQPNGGSSAFDDQRSAMLTNIGNSIILPNYQSLSSAANSLDSAVAVFISSPNSTTLAQVQIAFKSTYLSWQLCSPFGFGPAEQEYASVDFNTFPTDTAKINSNLNQGGYNLDATSNLAAKGFPAIDYLVFGVAGTNSSILFKYTTEASASKRIEYLKALTARIKTKTTHLLNDWQPASGNYFHTFTTASGTDVGSSLGQLINSLNYDYEILKNYKLGLPLGKLSLGTIYPEKVEAFYSGISSQLALNQMKTIQSIYLGGDGLGLDDYLVQIHAQYNGGSLNDAIKNQFSLVISKLQALHDPLSVTIQNDYGTVDATYKEVQKLLVMLKTDMPSAMGVLITYEDTDGD